MKIDLEELVIKQEIKEEDEVSFELIKDHGSSHESDKKESLCSEIKEEESFLDMKDNKTYFLADDIKQEKRIKKENVDDSKMNEDMNFKEEEINCEWSESMLNELDPLDLRGMEACWAHNPEVRGS